jgi:hypothetical protein
MLCCMFLNRRDRSLQHSERIKRCTRRFQGFLFDARQTWRGHQKQRVSPSSPAASNPAPHLTSFAQETSEHSQQQIRPHVYRSRSSNPYQKSCAKGQALIKMYSKKAAKNVQRHRDERRHQVGGSVLDIGCHVPNLIDGHLPYR